MVLKNNSPDCGLTLIERLRHQGFWLSDRLRGASIRQHYEDIAESLGDGARLAHQHDKLAATIDYAITNVPFYKCYRAGCDLTELPVINKDTVRGDMSRFLSCRFKMRELTKAVTSGSTGTPFVTYQDRDKRSRNFADVLWYSEKAGYVLGQRLYYLKIWPKEKRLSAWMQRVKNFVPIDVLSIRESDVEHVFKSVTSKGGCSAVIGYVSALESFCKISQKLGIDWRGTDISAIITISETLHEGARTLITEVLGKRPVMRYSNLENGILAQEDSSGEIWVNFPSYYIEILKMSSDERANPGEPGRIVVTDLFNKAMPLIRYDTGDIGIASHWNESAGCMRLSSIEGRILDQIVDTQGDPVSSYLVYRNMWQYPQIKQYQLIQFGPGEYVFKINVADKFHEEDKIRSQFLEYLGKDACIKIEYVDEIPVLSSGKRRMIVNKMRSNGGILGIR